jgi:hypothetical protein
LTDIELKLSAQNVYRCASLSIEEKMNKLKQNIGSELYEHLLKGNANELAFYKHACQVWK